MPRKLILLLGMHRSGTSLAAQAFALSGIPMGDALHREGREDNADGYWEDQEIVAVQDAALKRIFGGPLRAWGAPGLGDVFEGADGPAERQTTKAALQEIALARFAAADVFAFKDPRTARFLPLWRDIADTLGAELIPVLMLRSPWQVAQSLLVRNGVPHALGEFMWLRHMFDILHGVGDCLAGVIDYPSWFASRQDCLAVVGRVAERAGVHAEPRFPPIREAERHHREEGAVLPIAAEMYSALRATGGQPPAAELCMALAAKVHQAVEGWGGWPLLGSALAESRVFTAGLRIPLRFPESEDGTAPPRMLPMPGTPLLRNGNRFCFALSGAFFLHANSPEEPPANLEWHGMWTDMSARLVGVLAVWSAQAPTMQAELTISDGVGELILERSFQIAGRSRVMLDVPLPARRLLHLSLAVRPSESRLENARLVVSGLRIEMNAGERP
jgi:hypothetical protein